MLHHGKVVCNKQVSQPTLSLKLLQKVDNLCLDGNVQSRNGLIAYNKIRIYCKCTCNTNTLALSTGKLMRETICMLCLKTNGFQKLQLPWHHVLFYWQQDREHQFPLLQYPEFFFAGSGMHMDPGKSSAFFCKAHVSALYPDSCQFSFRRKLPYHLFRIIQMDDTVLPKVDLPHPGLFPNQTKSLSFINLKGNVINCF